MTDVDIEYCVPCGMLDRATDLQRTLLESYGMDLESVSLVTGDGGIFQVRIDGDVAYDKDEEGYDEGAIVDRVGKRV